MHPPNVIRHDRLGPLTIPLHGLHSMALSYGEDQFRRKGCCPPTFLVAIGTDVVWIEHDWQSADERAFTFERTRLALQAMRARAYSFISEVYVSGGTEEEVRRKSQQSLRWLPKEERDEMLWIDSWDRQGTNYCSQYLITPRRHGLAFLGPRVDEKWDEMRGRASNLFQPPTEPL